MQDARYLRAQSRPVLRDCRPNERPQVPRKDAGPMLRNFTHERMRLRRVKKMSALK